MSEIEEVEELKTITYKLWKEQKNGDFTNLGEITVTNKYGNLDSSDIGDKFGAGLYLYTDLSTEGKHSYFRTMKVIGKTYYHQDYQW